MTARLSRATHAVLDTDATSWLLDPRPLPQAENIRAFLGGRARVVSFVTVTELRYGALRARWGQLRLRGLERSLGDLEVIQTNESLVGSCQNCGMRLRGLDILSGRRCMRPTVGSPPPRWCWGWSWQRAMESSRV